MSSWLKKPGGYTKYYEKHRVYGFIMRSGAIIRNGKPVQGWTVRVGNSLKYPALTLTKAKKDSR
jgi:hypothetical protein